MYCLIFILITMFIILFLYFVHLLYISIYLQNSFIMIYFSQLDNYLTYLKRCVHMINE